MKVADWRWQVVRAMLAVAAVLGGGCRLYALEEKRQQQQPRFETDILPLLQAKCLRCHGEKSKKAELDLRTRAGILKGSESGPVVQPGKPEESPLYEMVHSGKMPPGKNNKLNPTEVETIRRWIAAGARFPTASAGQSEP